MNTTTTMPIMAPAALHPAHIIPHPLERLYYRFPQVQRGEETWFLYWLLLLYHASDKMSGETGGSVLASGQQPAVR